MTVTLQNLRLPLASFTLTVDCVLTGRITALFGASGAGKTTLLELITGLRRPETGRILIGDRVLTDASQKIHLKPENRDIGYVPQDGALFPHLTVGQNLRYGAKPGRAESAGMTIEHLGSVLELTDLYNRRIDTLSGGEKQRVALGRALLSAPQLLLLDEPLGGLDTPLKERLLPYLSRVRDEFAIPMIYVTHSADEVMALCDDVVVLAQGRVSQHDRPERVFITELEPRHRLGPSTSFRP